MNASIANARKIAENNRNRKFSFFSKAKDPGSAGTHAAGLAAALIAAPFLLIHAAARGAGTAALVSLGIFIGSMICLYGASTAYHYFDLTEKANTILKKLDHMMIFILIAGTYTPICVITLAGHRGMLLLAAVWSLAAAGIAMKAFWVFCPRWVSSVIYIAMGWACVIEMPQIVAGLYPAGFAWLLAGGLFYTVGGVIYALKLQAFNDLHPNFGSHEIFHLFVLAGSFCHYILMFAFLI